MSLKDKIIAFDIDGTLARGNAVPSDYTYQQINRLVKEGYHITLVTGRAIVSSIEIYQKCNLNSVGVFCNGALVYDPITHKKLRDITIPFETINSVLENKELMDKIQDLLIEIDYDTYALTGNGWPNAKVIGDFRKTLPQQPHTMVVMVKDPMYQKDVANIINKGSDYHYRYWSKVGEYYNINFSKKDGVIEMLKYYGKTKDDLIFFGDGENDKELIAYAGLGIAMKNAEEETKKCAKQITKYTNEEDGAIKHLLEMIENEK